MEKIIIIVENHSDFSLPEYKSIGASGMDVKADLKRTYNRAITNEDKIQPIINFSENYDLSFIHLYPNEIKVIQTGLFVEIPKGYEIQVRSRSGLAVQGIIVANAPGTIDSDYRGEVGIILANLGTRLFTVNHGDRIAQLVLVPVFQIEWDISKPINSTDRGVDGFGSTGK